VRLETLSPQGHALLALLALMRHVAMPLFDGNAFGVAADAHSKLYVNAFGAGTEGQDIYRFEDALQAIGDIAKAVCA
jgi:hypothetical protein